MTFWEGFFRTLRWRPRQALAGLYWHLTRRKVRARNRLRISAEQSPRAYSSWIRGVEGNSALAARVPAIVENWRRRPKFSILLLASTEAGSNRVERTITSVKEQFYTNWELIVAADGAESLESTNGDSRFIALPAQPPTATRELELGIAVARGDFLVPLRAGQLLSRSALFRLAESSQSNEQPSILYGDQDEIDARGQRVRPWFKPRWDEEMFLAQDYLSDACAVDARLARDATAKALPCDEAAVFALLLAAIRAAPGAIIHVPYVLAHIDAELSHSNQAARVAAVNHHLRTSGATSARGPFDTVKTDWPLPKEAPGVSIIIPTRDKVHLLRTCVESVLEGTTYPNYELIIVDNGSTEREALAYLADVGRRPDVRVISYDHPFNYSAINNFAAGYASAPYLCLLNNDTEVLTENWLTEMMRYAVRPEVGAVGAKLLYDDGSIQHAGVVIGICGAAGHAHRFEPANEPGYFGQVHLTHVVSAVTAACLVVGKRKFEMVGGLDAENFAIAYNDVDFCLKLERAGLRNVYVPHAELLHHESKSRGQDHSPEHIDRFMRELAALQERWGTKTYDDPRHNPNLDRDSETFTLRL